VDANNYIRIYIHTDDTIRAEVKVSGTSEVAINGTGTVGAAWSYARLTKNSSTWTLSLDGASQGTDSYATLPDWAVGWTFGSGTVAGAWLGYMDDIQLKTEALTASAFTPPNPPTP